MQREGFIIYKSFYEPLKILSNEQLGKLFRAIFEYQVNGIEKVEPDIKMAFEFFKNQFRLDNEKYEKIVERNKINGSKGGRPKTQENPKNPLGFKKPKKADKDKEKEKDKEKDKDNDTTITSSIYDFLENVFGRSLYEPEYNIVETWEDNDLTKYAINQAVLNGVFNIKYIDKILFSYKKNNITTVQQAQMAEEEFNKNKNKPRSYGRRQTMEEVDAILSKDDWGEEDEEE